MVTSHPMCSTGVRLAPLPIHANTCTSLYRLKYSPHPPTPNPRSVTWRELCKSICIFLLYMWKCHSLPEHVWDAFVLSRCDSVVPCAWIEHLSSPAPPPKHFNTLWKRILHLFHVLCLFTTSTSAADVNGCFVTIAKRKPVCRTKLLSHNTYVVPAHADFGCMMK